MRNLTEEALDMAKKEKLKRETEYFLSQKQRHKDKVCKSKNNFVYFDFMAYQPL